MKPIQLFIEVSALKVQKMVSQAPFPAKKNKGRVGGDQPILSMQDRA